MKTTHVQPRLVVDDASAAIDFYVAALDAREEMRFADPSGKIVHAEVTVGTSSFSLTEADGQYNFSPGQVGGTPMLMRVSCHDADAIGDAMVANGADVLIPIDDRDYGFREGRLRDPGGHLWIISQLLG